MRTWVSIALVASLIGCVEASKDEEKLGPPPGKPVAWIGDETIVVEDLKLGKRVDEEMRQAALDAAVLDRLAVLEARDRGLDERPKVARRIAAIRRRAGSEERAVLRETLRTELAASVRMSEAELREHFEANPDQFRERHYTLRRASYERRDQAEAAAASREPLAETLGPASAGALPPELRSALSGLRRSGGRGVVESEGGWWAVEVVSSDLATPESFEAVRETVRRVVLEARTQDLLAELLAGRREGLEVRVDEAVLKRVKGGRRGGARKASQG